MRDEFLFIKGQTISFILYKGPNNIEAEAINEHVKRYCQSQTPMPLSMNFSVEKPYKMLIKEIKVLSTSINNTTEYEITLKGEIV